MRRLLIMTTCACKCSQHVTIGSDLAANQGDRHCKYDEDHDQASDYEETLECAVCSVFCKGLAHLFGTAD